MTSRPAGGGHRRPARLAALARRLAGLAGWRRAGAAALLGAIGMLALPPAHLVPALAVAFTGLVWLLDGAAAAPNPLRAGFRDGWWFGFGYLAVGLYWIAAALFVDIARFWWLVPFAVLALPAALALFVGLVGAVLARLALSGPARVLALAVAWTVGEWTRGVVLTGFPWNLAGYAWTAGDAAAQGAALVGAYGLSALAVLIAAAPATLADPGSRARRQGLPLVAAALLALALAGGWWRLAGAEAGDQPGVRLRLVQAAVPQTLKWDPGERDRILERHIALSRGPGFAAVTHVIWPETAAPSFLDRDPERRALVARAAPPGGLVLVGTNRTTPERREPFQVWNSLQAIAPDGSVVGHYDKAHLVPFGEYLPARAVLGRLGLGKITAGTVDFSAGPGPRTLALPGLPPVGPLICYEAIFPGAVTARESRPAWLLNLTNDGWYGRTAGPYQHLAIARMRTVEEGLPLVRAANNGISAVFDAYGRERARLPLDASQVLDSPLPSPIDPTPFARLGGLAPGLLLLILALIAAALQRTRQYALLGDHSARLH